MTVGAVYVARHHVTKLIRAEVERLREGGPPPRPPRTEPPGRTTMTTSDCPPDDDLRAYLDEALPPEGARVVDEHIQGCDRCLVALERLLDVPSRTIREALAMAAWTSGGGSTVAWPPGPEAPRRNSLIRARIGPYRIDRYLGGGGMGDVYLAHDVDFPDHGAPRDDGTDMDGAEVIRRRVAIKFIKTGRDGVEMIREFYNNAALGTHSNIAALFHTGSTDDGLPYLVMEYVRGGLPIDEYVRGGLPIDEYVRGGLPIDRYREDKGLTIRDRVRLFRSVLEGVQHAHKHLIVHLDLKPGNILVTDDGMPKLVDFGVARLLERHAAGVPGRLGQAEGLTWEYASPEQARRAARLMGHSRGDPAAAGEARDSRRDPDDGGRDGQRDVIGVASDIYSLGVVLHELLTGHRLNQFRGKSISEKVRTICETQPEAPSRVAASPGDRRQAIPADLDKIVAKALAKDPGRRFESAREFGDALGRLAGVAAGLDRAISDAVDPDPALVPSQPGRRDPLGHLGSLARRRGDLARTPRRRPAGEARGGPSVRQPRNRRTRPLPPR